MMKVLKKSLVRIKHYTTCFDNLGFTIIELLVVFSLIAILAGLGIVSFVTYNRTQQIVQTANQITLLFQEARFNALSSVKPQSTPLGQTINCDNDALDGYRVEVFSSFNEVRMYLVCGLQEPFLMRSVVLPSELSIGAETTCTNVTYDTLTATAVNVPCEIVIEGFGNDSITILVDEGGLPIQEI